MSADPLFLRTRLDAGGGEALVASLRPPPHESRDVRDGVEAIIAEVRAGGDAALVAQAARFGSPGPPVDSLRVAPEAIAAAHEAADPELLRALEFAAAQVRAVAEAQRPRDVAVRLDHGQQITVRSVAVDSVGCYVPGGRAAYPSSLLMAVVPAQVAGVGRIAVASPPGPGGEIAPVILAAAAVLGIDEVYAIGGAGAIAAFAYGTESVAPVAVVAGPGSAWVTEAKRQVLGAVGIDSLAGPSEILIIADATAEADLIAADLGAQAEHGPDSVCVLASIDPALTDRVATALGAPRARTALVDCPDIDAAIGFAESFAPEHLQLMLEPAEAAGVAARVSRAGCVFVGRTGATAFGDYVAGSNHILPTGGAARFASAVGPATFMRRMSVVELPQGAVEVLTPHLAAIAQAEGFPEHSRSAELRIAGERVT